MHWLRKLRSVARAMVLASAAGLSGGIAGACAQASDVDRADLIAPVEFEGVVQAARQADISPRFDGLLQSIEFRAGDFVEEGQLLFQLMTTEQEYLLRIDQANLERATAQLHLAEAALGRAKELSSRDVVSQAQLQEAVASRDIAAASQSAAKTQVEMREIIISEYSLYAPFDGIISEPFVNEGAYITKEAREVSRLATVTQIDPIVVATEVPYDIYAERLALLGSKEALHRLVAFLILPDGTEYPHRGRIVSGVFGFDEETQKISSVAEFPNPDHMLRPGLRVRIRSMVRPEGQ